MPDSYDFAPADPRLFFSRNDPLDPRLGDLVRALPHKDFGASDVEPVAVISGYPDDEGIGLNGGRIGAAHAPDLVRKYLYKMTPSLFGRTPEPLFDRGNLSLSRSLKERHDQAKNAALESLNARAVSISIGGGHDYGYPDAAAYITWAQARGERPLVINFDAHLDVRPLVDGRLSSGTPFYRMLTETSEIDFAEIGIQSHCNSKAHYEWAKARGVRILSQEEIASSGESFAAQVGRCLGDWILRRRSVFISVDIDGFTSMAAPGASQSWATGFGPIEFFQCLDILKARLEIRSLGIYEVSPPLDTDDRTAKLAAQIIHRAVM